MTAAPPSPPVAGCSSGDLACYLSKSAAELLAAQNQVYKDFKADPKLLELFMPFTPTINTTDVPMDPKTGA
jgi:hypothetical protein